MNKQVEEVAKIISRWHGGSEPCMVCRKIAVEICQLSDSIHLKLIEEDNGLLEAGRKAIEDTLVEWRDNRLSEFNRGNGLVIREKDGQDSHIIRFGPETALRIGLKAIRQALFAEKED